MNKQARVIESTMAMVNRDRYAVEREPLGMNGIEVIAATGRVHIVQAFIGRKGGMTVRLNGSEKVWKGRDARIAWKVYTD